MPVNTKHPEYDNRAGQWQRCRDAVGGSDAIKARGELYLPRLSEQSDKEYESYLQRPVFYGASARTVQALSGTVMRKEPTVKVPKALDEHLTDVTMTGVSFNAFAKTTLNDVLAIGRYGVLVDMPASEYEIQLPYWAAYCAESIVNWETVAVRGVRQLALVVLCEQLLEAKPDDPYAKDCIEQYRVLRLNDGLYEAEIYRQVQNTKEWISHGVVTPTFRGQRLNYIPFRFFPDADPEIQKPPLLDMVDVNLSHFRSSADLEHGRHFCGLPMYFLAGVTTPDTIPIGSSRAIKAADPNAKAMIVEMNGQGLGALEKALESKEKLMAVLGARLLEESKPAVEAADTLKIRQSGEQSVLRSVAGSVSQGLSKLLEWTALWMGASPEEAKAATAKLNTDFTDSQMTFAELTALVGAWQSGAISYETMYYNMERGEVTRPGIEAEDERELIAMQEPSSLPGDGGLRLLNG